MKMLIHVLKFSTFFNPCVCYIPIMGLLILIIMHSTSQAASERKRRLSETKQRHLYTDQLASFQSRAYKLQKIIGQARSAQTTIRNNLPYRTDWDQQKALKPWKRIENKAQRLLEEIQDQIKTLESQSPSKRVRSRPYKTKMPRPLARNALLTRLDGKQERIATHRGDVVLVHFWATWCPPCIKEIPSLQRLYQQFHGRDFTILAVSLDAHKRDLRNFSQRRSFRFPVYFDPGRVVYQKMIGGLEVLPRSLLIDKKGRIVQSYTGARHLATPTIFTDIRNLLDPN